MGIKAFKPRLAIGAALLGAALMISSNGVQAGWTSGGGELIRDAQNPWFLQNTKVVNYCIQIDEVNFGLPKERVRVIVRKAIENWKEEFRDTVSVSTVFGSQIEVATQNFFEVPCAPSVDIRFQFGVLSGEQIKRLGDPTKLIGVAVRTDYDRVNMRGKGFIYISPGRGPLKFAGEKTIDNPWVHENGGLLYAVLMHELGHVFGLSHDGNPDPSGRWGTVMAARFPESLLMEKNARQEAAYWGGLPRPWKFGFPFKEGNGKASFRICTLATPMPSPGPLPDSSSSVFTKQVEKTQLAPSLEFFGIPSGEPCFHLEVTTDTFIAGYSRDWDSKFVEVGRAELSPEDLCSKTSFRGCTSTMMIWLPEGQTVVKGQSWGYVSGPLSASQMLLKGTYRSNDGELMRPFVFDALKFQITGTVNSKIFIDILAGY